MHILDHGVDAPLETKTLYPKAVSATDRDLDHMIRAKIHEECTDLFDSGDDLLHRERIDAAQREQADGEQCEHEHEDGQLAPAAGTCAHHLRHAQCECTG